MSEQKLKNKFLVRIDPDKCIGCGSCESISEAMFKVNEKGKAEVISQNGEDEDKLLAAQACPTNAIEVIDLETGEVEWPKVSMGKGGETGEE